MLVLAWRAGPGWIVLLNEDDEMHAVPYETITKPQSVRSKLRRAWMWRDTTNRPDEWWPQIVDLNSTGLACAVYRHRPAELRRAPACRRTSPAQRHTRISTFFIYQYPLDKIWHGTDQGNHQWQTETLTPPRHDSHRAGRLACAAYRSSLSVQRGLLRADTRSARFCPRGDTATIDRRADVRPPVVAPIALTEIVGQALTS